MEKRKWGGGILGMRHWRQKCCFLAALIIVSSVVSRVYTLLIVYSMVYTITSVYSGTGEATLVVLFILG